MPVSHTPDRLDIVFDDGNLVAHAGLSLTSQLAARLRGTPGVGSTRSVCRSTRRR